MKKIDGLNFVPFIDVMLVLLVITLTTATFVKTQKISVEIPEISQKGENSSVEKSVDLALNASGEVFLDGQKIDSKNLSTALQNLPKTAQIVLNGDKSAHLEKFLEVFDALQDLGFKNIFVLVKNKEKIV